VQLHPPEILEEPLPRRTFSPVSPVSLMLKSDHRYGAGETEMTNLFDPFAEAASSAATKNSSSAACFTTAAAILQKVLHIVSAIVVGDFRARFDST